MAYDELLADRVRRVFSEKKILYEEKKMMGGLCFMVDDKMCLGVHTSKKDNKPSLMARVGAEASKKAIQRPHCEVMDFTGRPMKAFVTISSEGIDQDIDLEYWIDLCLAFNPEAKSSKRRKSDTRHRRK